MNSVKYVMINDNISDRVAVIRRGSNGVA